MTEAFRDQLARHRLRGCASVGEAPVVKGQVWIRGRGEVRLGNRVVLDASTAAIEINAWDPGSVITIGDDVVISSGASLESVVSINIGARSRLGRFSKIMDTSFHSLIGDRHARPKCFPVEVGEDVEVGFRAVLLAGTKLGNGSAVGAGTVVSRRETVPPGSVVSGAPAVVR